jgi:subtilase family serine protease
MRILRSLPVFAFVVALIAGSALVAQQPAPAARIVEKIDESQLVTLKGNTLPAANAANDVGRVSPGLPMTDLMLVLSRSPEQQAAFNDFVASQYDATSPNYHHWLSPDQVGARFGPSPEDIATVSGWLSARGFVVNGVSKDRMSISFSGNSAQVQGAFHVEIHNLFVRGVDHIANMNDPQIPAALAPVIGGVKGLHNFFPRPLNRLGGKAIFDSQTGRWQRTSGAAALISPLTLPGRSAIAHHDFGTTNSQITIEDVAPYDFATIYNVLPLWNASTPIDGTGQTIAIAGTSDINTDDVATFRSIFGLPVGPAVKTIVANGIDPGQCTSAAANAECTIEDLTENTLDVEWAGAVAKNASIVLVVSGQGSTTTDTVFQSSQYVISNNTASILSVSYGLCELFEGTSGNAAYNNLWQSAATEGIAVLVASGDAGAATCDQGMDSTLPHPAQYGNSVNALASTAYNTAVGGTDLDSGSTPSKYWSATNNATNGSNALGYVPEVPWNDTCTNPSAIIGLQSIAVQLQNLGYNAVSPTDAESACNFAITWAPTVNILSSADLDLNVFVDTMGGGGGASNCTTSDSSTVASCSGGYAKPAWQAGVSGIPSDGKRDVPDISSFAGNGAMGSASLICVSANGSCTYSSTSEPYTQEVGGTSVATPAMAGVMALINQKAGSPQGNPNAELYKLAGTQTYASCSAETVAAGNSCYFNDADTGTIAMACASGKPDCTIIHSGDTVGVLSGNGAGVAFDTATGLGSLNVANIVNAWTATTGTATATVAISPSKTTLPADQSLSVPVTVTGSSGTPTGSVSLTSGTYTAPTGTLSGGAYTFNIPANSLATGSATLNVSYSGDATYAEATGSTSVTVTKLTPTVAVQPDPTNVGGQTTSVNVQVTVTGTGGTPTGTATLTTGSYNSSACTLAGGGCTIGVPATNLSTGSNTLTVNYSGDSVYVAASGSATVNVSALIPTVTVTAAPTALTTTGSTQVTVKVTGSGATPSGTVTLSSGGYSSGPQALASGSVTITVQGSNLAAGSDTLTANYSGDAMYLAATGSTTVTVTQVAKVAPTVTVTPASTSISAGQSLGVTVGVSGASGVPTGSVTLSSGSYTSSAQTLSNGSASFTIPANTLAAGTDTLTATYSGDSIYNGATGTGTVAVTQAVFALSASAPAAVSRGGTATSTITVASSTGYAGSVTLTCALNSGGPTNQSGDAPTCSIPTSAVSVGGTATASVSTTGATSGALNLPAFPGRRIIGTSGAVLALLVFLGIPARPRSWRSMLGVIALLLGLGGLAACGSGGTGGGSGGGGGTSNPGTASGTYTFTVTGTGNPAVTPAPTTTFSVTVN